MIETPYDDFHRDDYLEINSKRFDHLDSLNIDFANKSVLEIGAGIGDHTDNLLRYHPKSIHVTDVREENLLILREKFKDNKSVSIGYLDMDNPVELDRKYDICYCYGLLYHLSKVEEAIRFLSNHTKDTLLLETCVDYFNENTVNNIQEQQEKYSQSYHGEGCRPGRIWLHAILTEYFDFVYIPLIQPNHDQFPTNWIMSKSPSRLTRSIFVASRKKIDNYAFVEDVPSFQVSVKEEITKAKLMALKAKNLFV